MSEYVLPDETCCCLLSHFLSLNGGKVFMNESF
jgi:hypothetical protein